MALDDDRDWVGAEADYRAGIISINAIRKKYGISTAALYRRIKKQNWQRDLTPQVQAELRNQTIREIAKTENPEERETLSDAQIIETAARRGATANTDHLRLVGDLKTIASRMSALLKDATSGDKKLTEKAISALFVRSGDNLNTWIRTLGDTIEKVQKMERKALGLDDDTAKPPPATAPDMMSEQERFERALVILAKVKEIGKR